MIQLIMRLFLTYNPESSPEVAELVPGPFGLGVVSALRVNAYKGS